MTKPVTRVFLIRHGDREGEELSPKGVRQARAIAKRLEGEEIKALYSSPIPRTLQTAQALEEVLGVPIQEVLELRDIEAGENLSAVRQRAVPVVEEILQRHQGESVAIVSHEGVCQAILGHLLGLDDAGCARLTQSVGAISTFEVREDRRVITAINDTCHLRHLDD